MNTHRSPEFQSIAILRALKLGDMLCCVPALRALRVGFPRSRIVLIGLPWCRDFARHLSHLIDEFMEFPGFPGIPEHEFRPGKLCDFLQKAQVMKFSLALQMHGSGEHVNDFIHLLGAKTTGGFYKTDAWRPPRGYWIRYPDHYPEIWRHLSLAKAVGAELQGTELEFPLFFRDVLRVRRLLSQHSLKVRRYACIHPGAISAPSWGPEKFSQMADFLSELQLPVLLTGTSAEDQLCRAVKEHCRSRVISIAGSTDLGLLAAVIAQSRLVICHDTGVSHLAAALRTPSIIISGRTELSNAWPPLNRQLHRFLTGIQGVTVQSAQEETRDLLRYSSRYCSFQRSGESSFATEKDAKAQLVQGEVAQ